MKINIASTNRFHLLDLARELQIQGYDVRFYSYVPSKRCEKFGLTSKCCSFLWIAVPFLLLQKVFPKSEKLIYYRNIVLDKYLSCFMRPCDVYIALGSVYLNSLTAAKAKFGASSILEWGSKHIIEQRKQFGTLEGYNKTYLNRELKGYELANYISIPAEHVKRSFIKHGVPNSKLMVVPYGVDLRQFPPTVREHDCYDLIYVGGWRYEKGCDLLIDLCRNTPYTLLHVGPIINLDFPQVENMTHVEPVNQYELTNYYKKAKVFILPSRSEGLALVLCQALSSGLPIVCSIDSGGEDLKKLLGSPKYINLMEDYTDQSIIKAVKNALIFADSQSGLRYLQKDIEKELSWNRYGKQYSNFVAKLK